MCTVRAPCDFLSIWGKNTSHGHPMTTASRGFLIHAVLGLFFTSYMPISPFVRALCCVLLGNGFSVNFPPNAAHFFPS